MKTNLLKKVRSFKALEKAWYKIEENARTSKSEEVKKEINAFRENATSKLKSLCGKICNHSFKFGLARGIPFPKTDSTGKKDKKNFRPIVLATVEARIVQRAILDALMTVPKLRRYIHTPHSFGGIRKQSDKDLAAVPAAIRAILDSVRSGAKFVVCADISKFFTRISKSEVTEIVSGAVEDPEFLNFFRKAIHVELSNMADLRERADAFPIGDIGVAQGNCLSPLLGNIVLYDFDTMMNSGDCRCIRYIDDLVILAPDRASATYWLGRAKKWLADHQMELAPDKSFDDPISISERFEVLGIEFSSGLIRPSCKSQKRFLDSINAAFQESSKALYAFRANKTIDRDFTVTRTLRKVDGIINGWGKHYWFCNDIQSFRSLNDKIATRLQQYSFAYSDTLTRTGEEHRSTLLGISQLGSANSDPFKWPKQSEIAQSKKIAEPSILGAQLSEHVV